MFLLCKTLDEVLSIVKLLISSVLLNVTFHVLDHHVFFDVVIEFSHVASKVFAQSALESFRTRAPRSIIDRVDPEDATFDVVWNDFMFDPFE